jgi:hypothetical protein
MFKQPIVLYFSIEKSPIFSEFQTREFLRILDTQRVRDSNPKCQVHSEISKEKNAPKIEVQFGKYQRIIKSNFLP